MGDRGGLGATPGSPETRMGNPHQSNPFHSTDYWAKLVDYTGETSRDDFTLLEFATLQRLNLIHLQNELALIKADFVGCRKTSEEHMEKLRTLLREYATAIRDLDYLTHLPQVTDPQSILDKRILLSNAFPLLANRAGAPYYSVCLTIRRDAVRKTDAVREFLRKNLPRRLAWSAEERDANKLRYSQRLPTTSVLPLIRPDRAFPGCCGWRLSSCCSHACHVFPTVADTEPRSGGGGSRLVCADHESSVPD
ncbi:hypothetical protein N656DRAFT_69339 [Canariomyces notabilis]|uniref:Uncharacterized protein n=1 Tax=Canariomyces notabilis TaxID=2074819 RepID=A0AAN6TNU8_9PEZI|nr:hypothetical protein N656DRAFT_69339 [Canariomyces arenarius]